MEEQAIVECPVCLETLKKPILQCKVGHSICGSCITRLDLKNCPQCRDDLTTTRNYQLEQLLENLTEKIPLKCRYTKEGCQFKLVKKEMDLHEAECRYRQFHCEGKKFAGWNCSWKGSLNDLHEHFVTHHSKHAWVDYKVDTTRKINLKKDCYDIQVIPFFNGSNYFWYKHKVDFNKKKVYWAIQLIGIKKQAASFMYEFEIHEGPVRKFKVTEICENDVVDVNDIFHKENCVVISFNALKNYLNQNGELSFKFRVMKKPQ